MNATNRLAFIAATSAVVVAVVGGFILLGSPGKQRQLEADRRRVQNLHGIARRLYDRRRNWNREEEKPFALPATLSEQDPRDPLTDEPYEYRTLEAEGQYQLCAEFALPSPEPHRDRFWEHPSGRHCFDLDITENPPFPSN